MVNPISREGYDKLREEIRHLEEDVIGDPAIYPTEEALKTLYTTTPYPAKVQRVVTRMWTKIKSGT